MVGDKFYRWVALAGAVATCFVFLNAQDQRIDVSYAESPSKPAAEGAAGELSGATLPSVSELTAMVARDPVVRLPGAIARWDERAVRAALGDSGGRILVTPPGIAKEERSKLYDVKNATYRVVGVEVSGDIYSVSGGAPADNIGPLATGDITNRLLLLIATVTDKPKQDRPEQAVWREPTAAETAKADASARVVTDSEAFPGAGLRVVELPRQPYGQLIPRYGPALAKLHPDTPIVVQYGGYLEYTGQYAEDFADIAASSYFSRYADDLGQYVFPQKTSLDVYLGIVTDIRYAGMFDRPVPYRPVDPLRVTLPFLPFLFAACVLVFVVLSVREAGPAREPRRAGVPARLAALTSLAVEISQLENRRDEALTRAFARLSAAREALADVPGNRYTGDQHVSVLLDEAEKELDACARRLPFRGFRPKEYLA